MAPFRPSGRSNRSGRSQADHDVFEGLPIKQWRQSETTVGLPQAVGDTKPGDNAMPELPLPRDSQLLSPWTQALLREARRPRLAKRKEPTEDEKGEEEEEGEKEMQTGFLAKKWAHVPAHLEEPEREYIAKRRKGLPSLHTTLALQAAISLPSSTATRKAKVMKADADGKTTIYEVLVPEGQIVEGEVAQDTEMPDAAPGRAAPGTVIEGVGIANAEGVIVANDLLQPQPPPRRRNMPPKRVKKGGPGRGKKKVMFTAEGQPGTSTPGGSGAPTTPAMGDGGVGEPMDIDSTRKEDDDGEEDEDDDDDREDGEVSDAEGAEGAEGADGAEGVESTAQETPLTVTDSAIPSEAEQPPSETKQPENPEAVVQEAPKPDVEVSTDTSAKPDITLPTPEAPLVRESSGPSESTPKNALEPEPTSKIPTAAEPADTPPRDQSESQREPSSAPELPLAEPSHPDPIDEERPAAGGVAADDSTAPDTTNGADETIIHEPYDGEDSTADTEPNHDEDVPIMLDVEEVETSTNNLDSKDSEDDITTALYSNESGQRTPNVNDNGGIEVAEMKVDEVEADDIEGDNVITAEEGAVSFKDGDAAGTLDQPLQTANARNSDALSGLEAALNSPGGD